LINKDLQEGVSTHPWLSEAGEKTELRRITDCGGLKRRKEGSGAVVFGVVYRGEKLQLDKDRPGTGCEGGLVAPTEDGGYSRGGENEQTSGFKGSGRAESGRKRDPKEELHFRKSYRGGNSGERGRRGRKKEKSHTFSSISINGSGRSNGEEKH